MNNHDQELRDKVRNALGCNWIYEGDDGNSLGGIIDLIHEREREAVQDFAEQIKEWPELPDIRLIEFIDTLLTKQWKEEL